MVALTQAERNYPVVLPRFRFRREVYGMEVYKNGIYTVGLNWAPLLRKLGTTISSSTWALTNSGSANVTLSSATAGTLTTKVTVTVSASGGVDYLKNTVTLADGQKEIRLVRLEIMDPDGYGADDYTF